MIFIMWCTWAPESKFTDRNANHDIFRLPVCTFTFLDDIANAATIPLGLPHDPTFARG